MISSIQGNAGGLPATAVLQVGSGEVPGEMEHDGDMDEVASTPKATAAWSPPTHLGKRIDTLA